MEGSKRKANKNTVLMTAAVQTFWAFYFEAGSLVSAKMLLMRWGNTAMPLIKAAQFLPLVKRDCYKKNMPHDV